MRAAGTRPPSMRRASWSLSDYNAYCAKWRSVKLTHPTAVSSLQGMLVLACFTA